MLFSKETYVKYSQTPGTRHEIDDIFAPVLLLHQVLGYQILDPNWSWPKFQLPLVLLSIYSYYGTIYTMQTTDNFVMYSGALFTLIVMIQFLFQVFYFIFYRSSYREIYLLAKTSLLDVIEEISPERRVNFMALLRKITKTVLISIIIPTLNSLFIALWFYFKGQRICLSPSTSTLMPMTSPTYEIGFLLHLMHYVMIATTLIGLNMWFVVLTFFLSEACDCAVKILNTRIDKNHITYARRLNETLAKFYSVHVKITKYLIILNDMHKWPLLVPITAIYALTCLFLLVLTKEFDMRLAMVIVVQFIQISAFNMLGERIKTKANDIQLALLNFNWMGMELKDRKNYFIIVCYMNKSFSVRTAVGVELSLLTLSSIYKGSYQAYAVLNTMDN